jgi:putative hydroxymethylpyrimidine transport system substrate-binding protein
MRHFQIYSLLVATIAILAGCGESGDTDASEPRYLTFASPAMSLDGQAGPENAGPLVAVTQGFFRDLGLQPTINPPIFALRATKYVDQEVDDVAIAQEPQVVLAQAEGLPIIIFGSLVSEPTMAMIWLPKSEIRTIADLKGKTVAYPGIPFQEDFLEYVLKGAGLAPADVKLENAGYHLTDALASGRADAIFGGSGNEEGALLETQGFAPVVTGVAELGVPDYDELVLVARRDRYAKGPGLFDRILKASIRGNEAAAEDPKAAADAVVSQSLGAAAAGPARAGIDATIPLLSQTGDVDEDELEGLIDWMYETEMIDRRIPASDLLAGSAGGEGSSER